MSSTRGVARPALRLRKGTQRGLHFFGDVVGTYKLGTYSKKKKKDVRVPHAHSPAPTRAHGSTRPTHPRWRSRASLRTRARARSHTHARANVDNVTVRGPVGALPAPRTRARSLSPARWLARATPGYCAASGAATGLAAARWPACSLLLASPLPRRGSREYWTASQQPDSTANAQKAMRKTL